MPAHFPVDTARLRYDADEVNDKLREHNLVPAMTATRYNSTPRVLAARTVTTRVTAGS